MFQLLWTPGLCPDYSLGFLAVCFVCSAWRGMLLCYGPLQVGITLIHGGEAGSEVTAAKAQDLCYSPPSALFAVPGGMLCYSPPVLQPPMCFVCRAWR